MKLSIITVNYNNKAGLEKTIASVMSQTWREFEWIIVDGGSSDGGKDVIVKLAEDQNANISYWCSESDKGIYNAMNKGVTKASGEYILFMNSADIFYSNSVLEKIFQKDYKADILYGDCDFFWDNQNHIVHYEDDLSLKYLYTESINHQSTFIRRELLVNTPYSEKYRISSDWRNWVIWMLAGKTFMHLPITVTIFDCEGLSNTNVELAQCERQEMKSEIFPKSVIKILDEVISIDNIKRYNPELEQTYMIIKKGRFYKYLLRKILCMLQRL